MQPLRMKTCLDMKLPVFTCLDEGIRTQWVNCRRRNCRGIVACNENRRGESSSSRSFFSRNHNYALLKHQMEVAAKSEDYEQAARIRDSLKCFEEDVPVLRLRKLLKEAIEDERFQVFILVLMFRGKLHSTLTFGISLFIYKIILIFLEIVYTVIRLIMRLMLSL
ncbi:putative UVR domain-containing protein [Lupinus albus]|uniref:Putative UVR domain-containing protein n=1 Tax=Lupinus albus TaxID=3870 RepID=A0A6A4Q3T9_LUPAL|nr:putative UVR domain-containing protein [Lupinus albus]